MELRIKTDKTAGAIRAAIEKKMAENRRKQVFTADAEIGGSQIVVFDESDYNTCPCWLPGFKGVRGIQRHAWERVPGYAERCCNHLAGIMIGENVPLN